MKKTIQYQTLEERENIINDNSTWYLIEEKNILEGNFLVFSDGLPNNPPTVEDRLSAVEEATNFLLEL